MRRLPPESTRPATLFPYTTIFLSEAPFVEALLHEHHGRPVGEAGVGARREGGGLPLAGGDLFRRHLAGDRAAHLARLGMAVVAGDVEPGIAQRNVGRQAEAGRLHTHDGDRPRAVAPPRRLA